MPILERSNLTASSRTMVPAYPLLALGVAMAYIFGDPARTATPSFDVAREVMTIRSFGYIFLFVAALEILGMALKTELFYIVGLAIGLGVSFGWGLFFVGSIIFTDDASLVSPLLWSFVGLAHIATFRSLTKDNPVRDPNTRERESD